jgi:hypothetical protein
MRIRVMNKMILRRYSSDLGINCGKLNGGKKHFGPDNVTKGRDERIVAN